MKSSKTFTKLDIFVIYLDPSSSAVRAAQIRLLGRAIRTSSSTHTSLIGDFNFIAEPNDRVIVGGSGAGKVGGINAPESQE